MLPLEGLDKPPEGRAVLLDITCDSDGTIDHYVDGDGVATTMPMPPYDPENPPALGFFMVGAYREILGNMHNLFGDTASVDVYVFPDGSVETELSDEGDTVADMLEYVQLDPCAAGQIPRSGQRNRRTASCRRSSRKSLKPACTATRIWKTSDEMKKGRASLRHPAFSFCCTGTL